MDGVEGELRSLTLRDRTDVGTLSRSRRPRVCEPAPVGGIELQPAGIESGDTHALASLRALRASVVPAAIRPRHGALTPIHPGRASVHMAPQACPSWTTTIF